MKLSRFSFPRLIADRASVFTRRGLPQELARILALLPLVLATSLAAPAPQQPVPDQLDLPTAIAFALENNLAIRQARERIREQEGLVMEVTSQAIPNLGANALYQRNTEEIGQTFPPSDRFWSVNLTASQTLYAGGGVRASMRSAKLTREAAILDLQSVINEALLAVRVAYYDVLLARERINVQEQNLALLQRQFTNVSNRFESGSVSSFERLQAQVALANAQAPLIRARNEFRLAVEELRQALGFTTNQPESLRRVPEFTGVLDFTPVNYDLQAAFDAAHANRPDLQRVEKLAAAREELVKRARAGYYPDLALVGGYQFRKGTTDRFGDSQDGLLVGLQSQWAIFDGRATRGRVAQARSLAEQMRLQLIEANLAVEVEVRRAYSSYQEAAELAEAAQRTVGQAEESVRLAAARYDAGTATQLDVLQAQVALTESRTNQIEAYHGYNVAVARLRKAMGAADVPYIEPR